jgi:DNA-directed RNA polymerase specialized sigma24 family protein
MTTGVTQRSRFALVDALNAEWARMDSDDRLAGYARSVVARWAEEYPELSGCGNPEDLLAAIRDDPDPVLLCLIGIHQSGSISAPSQRLGPGIGSGLSNRPEGPLSVRPHHHAAGGFAGRVVLQTMLGKLVAMARRDRRHAVEDYVGALWARTGSYPLQRRRRRVASNLALDTLKCVTGEQSEIACRPCPGEEFDRLDQRRLVGWGLGLPVTTSDEDKPSELTAHRVLRAARDLGLIDDSTRRLLLSVYAEGMTSRQAAEKYGLSPTTVRFRCSRAVRRMARHASAISAAA